MEHATRWSTAGAAAVATVASYEHAYALVRAHGEAGWTGRLVSLTVDALIYAGSMALLDVARRKTSVPELARSLLGLDIAATLAANAAHGLGTAPSAQQCPALAGARAGGSYERLMTVIRSSQATPDG
jgi:Arc/MetJ family transcription regulator